LSRLKKENEGNLMQAEHIITVINILFLLTCLLGIFHFEFFLYIAAILAAIALAFHWHKNIMINRLSLIGYVTAIFLILSNIISTIFVPVCYALVIGIGIYTTFWTKAGFIGVEGKNKTAIKRASLVFLGLVIVIPIGLYFASFQRYPVNILPFFVFFLIYKAARRYAEDAQHTHEVE
jgi:hypothetical protein